jgi:hypothetical protein
MEQLNYECEGMKAKRNKSHRYGEQKLIPMEKINPTIWEKPTKKT